MSERGTLFDVQAADHQKIDEKAKRVAEFNLMAYGDHEKAIKAIEDDIGRDERMHERAMADYRTTLRLRGLKEDSDTCVRRKLPEVAIRTKRLAIDWLRKNQPAPGDVWPKAV